MLHYFLTWFRTLRSEDGQDLAEYALLIALIALALVLVIGAMTTSMANTFDSVRNTLNSVPYPAYQP